MPLPAANVSNAFQAAIELPVSSSPGDQAQMPRRPDATVTIPPPNPLLPGMPTANSPAASYSPQVCVDAPRLPYRREEVG